MFRGLKSAINIRKCERKLSASQKQNEVLLEVNLLFNCHVQMRVGVVGARVDDSLCVF